MKWSDECKASALTLSFGFWDCKTQQVNNLQRPPHIETRQHITSIHYQRDRDTTHLHYASMRYPVCITKQLQWSETKCVLTSNDPPRKDTYCKRRCHYHNDDNDDFATTDWLNTKPREEEMMLWWSRVPHTHTKASERVLILPYEVQTPITIYRWGFIIEKHDCHMLLNKYNATIKSKNSLRMVEIAIFEAQSHSWTKLDFVNRPPTKGRLSRNKGYKRSTTLYKVICLDMNWLVLWCSKPRIGPSHFWVLDNFQSTTKTKHFVGHSTNKS